MTEQGGYLLLTNNPLVPEAEKEGNQGKKHTVVFLEASVQEVLARCQELLLQGGLRLAVDPMSGRHARPFPCLTLVLQETGGEAPAEDWKRILDYALLDSRRKEEYARFAPPLTEDYRILDLSFTSVVLESCWA